MHTTKKEFLSPGGLGPLSFSLNSLNIPAKELESPMQQNATLPITNSLKKRLKRKNENRDTLCRSWGPMDENANRDFWASIEEPYNFIMSSQLVPDVLEMNEKSEFPSTSEMELSWDMDDVSPSYVWDFSQFLEQYSELYGWLIQVQVELYNPTTFKDKVARTTQIEKLKRQTYRKKIFIEQCGRVLTRYPEKTDQISWRVNYLTNKWEQLETAFIPLKRGKNIIVQIDLEHEEQVFKKWLITMEGRIPPVTCRIPKGCSIEKLQDRFHDNMILLEDITAHGPILKDIIRQYESRAETNNDKEPDKCFFGGQIGTVDKPKKRIPRRVRCLDSRWQQVYLRSLEWHYHLQSVIAIFKNGPSSCSSDSDDEPVNKCRKLWLNSSVSSTVSSPRAAKGWSDYENNGSDTGSYIEYVDEGIAGAKSHVKDDYVGTNNSPRRSPLLVNSEIESLHLEPLLVVDQQHCAVTISETENELLSDLPTTEGSPTEMKNIDQINCNATTNDISNVTTIDETTSNCGTFEYKHKECDATRTTVTEVRHVFSRRLHPATTWKNRQYCPDELYVDEDEEQENLQKIIDDAILEPDWLNSNIPTDSDGSVCSRRDIMEDCMDTDSETSPEKSAVDETNASSVKNLIKGADRLIMEAEIGSRHKLKPLDFDGTRCNKQNRIRQWISQQRDSSLQDSCDASGELTTGESDVESNTSEKRSFFGPKSLSTSLDKTPIAEEFRAMTSSTPKLTLRGNKRRQNDQRPWSITDVAQIPGEDKYAEAISNKRISSSESTLHHLKGSSSDTAVEGKIPTNTNSDLTVKSMGETVFGCSSSVTAEEGKVSSPPESCGDATVFSCRASTASSSLKRRKLKCRRKSITSLGRRTICSESGELTRRLFGRTDQFVQSSELSNVAGVSPMQASLHNDNSLSMKKSRLHLEVSSACRRLSPRPMVRTPTSDLEGVIVPEDVGSLPEQAWDPYQESKYLSEPYSEDVDHDAARKLLDFGDDYRKYIDSDGSSLIGRPVRPRGKKPRPQGSVRSTSELESDSDIDCIHQLLNGSKLQFQQSEIAFRRCCNDPAQSADLQVVLATAAHHLDGLQKFIRALQKEGIGLETEMKEAQEIVRRWKALQEEAVERQRHLAVLLQLQKQIKSFKSSLEEIREQCDSSVRLSSLDTPVEFQKKIQIAKNFLGTVAERREDLTAINNSVHTFLSDSKLVTTPLKDELTDLYQVWDETQLRINGKISKLEGAETIWRLWEEQKIEMQQILNQDSNTLKVLDRAIQSGDMTDRVSSNAKDVARLLNERRTTGLVAKSLGVSNNSTKCGDLSKLGGNMSDSGTSGYESCSSDDLSERERRLANLKRLARHLEATLIPGSKAYSDISETIIKTEKQLNTLQNQCRHLLVPSLAPVEDDITISCPEIENLHGMTPVSLRFKRKPKGSNWLRKIVWAIIPLHAAILFLMCVAWLMEPSCCDNVNTLHFNMNPQLRFINGPPPV